MLKHIVAIPALLLALGLLVPGYGQGSKITVGVAGPLTGDMAEVGQEMVNAIIMAADEFNASGAIPGQDDKPGHSGRPGQPEPGGDHRPEVRGQAGHRRHWTLELRGYGGRHPDLPEGTDPRPCSHAVQPGSHQAAGSLVHLPHR